jgi:hypothetical protein
MYELLIVLGVVFVLTATIGTLLLISGRFLKLRRERAPEVVDPTAYQAKYQRADATEAEVEHRLAA